MRIHHFDLREFDREDSNDAAQIFHVPTQTLLTPFRTLSNYYPENTFGVNELQRYILCKCIPHPFLLRDSNASLFLTIKETVLYAKSNQNQTRSKMRNFDVAYFAVEFFSSRLDS